MKRSTWMVLRQCCAFLLIIHLSLPASQMVEKEAAEVAAEGQAKIAGEMAGKGEAELLEETTKEFEEISNGLSKETSLTSKQIEEAFQKSLSNPALSDSVKGQLNEIKNDMLKFSSPDKPLPTKDIMQKTAETRFGGPAVASNESLVKEFEIPARKPLEAPPVHGEVTPQERPVAQKFNDLNDEYVDLKNSEPTSENRARMESIEREIQDPEMQKFMKDSGKKLGKTNFFKEKASYLKMNWKSLAKEAVFSIGSAAVLGFVMAWPGMIQQQAIAEQKRKNLRDSIRDKVTFGGVDMQIPWELISDDHPELSPFLYREVDSGKKNSDGSYASGATSYYYVSKDSGDWARTWVESSDFPGKMVCLASGYQFTDDGLSHDSPLLPIYGSLAVDYGEKTIADFVNIFAKNKQAKMPMYTEMIAAPSIVKAPKNLADHLNNIGATMSLAAMQLKSTVTFGPYKIKPFVPRDIPIVPGKGYRTTENLPANGIYIYQCEDTPLVKLARLNGNTEAVDYIVALDSSGNIIPAHEVKNAKSKAFVPNVQITSICSLLNNKIYKTDGKIYQSSANFTFEDYGSQLPSSWTDKRSKYNYLQTQANYMQQVCVKGPFTSLKLTLAFTDDARIKNLLKSDSQIVPVYTSVATLGADSSGNPITDYFIAVKLVNGQFTPVNMFFAEPTYLISLVTSRIYTPDGNLAKTKVTPTEQVIDQITPLIQAALDARPSQNLPPLSSVEIGQKYMPAALNPYTLPFPSDYFTLIYNLSKVQVGDANQALGDLTVASRKLWGSPYDSETSKYRMLTLSIADEQKKTPQDKQKIADLQKQLAQTNQSIASIEAKFGKQGQVCQFTKNLLFNIYFKVPDMSWIHNGNYFYQSVPGSQYSSNLFAPGEYFVMSDTADPQSLTDNIGLDCTTMLFPYAISVSTGYVYDSNGNKVTDSSQKAIIFDVDALLNRVQSNQMKLGGFAFMQSGKPLNDMARALFASMQTYQDMFKQDLGPFYFYLFTLTVPQDFVSAFKNGQYIYQATAKDVPGYTDYMICIEEDVNKDRAFGVKYSNATTELVSLVTGMRYNRSGIIDQYNQSQLYSHISKEYQTISDQVKGKIQASAADFQKLTTPVPPPAEKMPVLNPTILANIIAQQDVPNHPDMRKNLATGNYYLVNNTNKTILDFNASADDIKLLYPQEVASGDYKKRVGDVGILYDEKGNYALHTTGWSLAGLRARYGVQITAQGEQLIPSNMLPLPLDSKDQNLRAGSSGVHLIVNSDAKFPTSGISSVEDPSDPGTKFYFYYLSQGNLNGKAVPMNSYLVRQVNSGKSIDRYIDMMSGYVFNPDGSLVIRKTEIVSDALGQTIQVVRDGDELQGIVIAGREFSVWDSENQPDKSIIYSLNDVDYNSMQIHATKSVSGNWIYEVSLDMPYATINKDASGSVTQITIGNEVYALKALGAQSWKDATGTISMKIDTTAPQGQTVYIVTYLKSSSGQTSTTASYSAPSTNYSVKIQDTYTGVSGLSIVNNITGATGFVVLDQNKPKTIQFNDLIYTSAQQGKNPNEYMMSNADQKKQIKVVMSSTGIMIYSTNDAQEVPLEYTYDAEYLSDSVLTNYIKNVWQLVPAVDIFANSKLVKSISTSLLKQLQESDLFVASTDKKLFDQARASGLFTMPTIYYDGMSNRYLYQFTDEDAKQPYYDADYKGWYIDLRDGMSFNDNGLPAGLSITIDTLNQITHKLNVAIVQDATGAWRVKFVPGGTSTLTK